MLSTKINNTLHLWFWVDHLIFGSFIFTDFMRVIPCRSQNKAIKLTLQLIWLYILVDQQIPTEHNIIF